ncbi:MAG: hypothetical protein ACXACK_08580, partial [Candidatus Hodarchaeales archaeon]
MPSFYKRRIHLKRLPNFTFFAIFWLILGICLTTVISIPAGISGIVPPLISSDLSLIFSQSPYYVTENALVESGATLTIEPGVEIRFAEGKALVIDGALVANGITAAPILFT